jgi:hypothetical protein
MDRRDKENFVGLVAAVGIIVLALWLGHLWAASIKMQNCVFSGRRNCNPIPMNDSQ